jgi:hypothetical protein
MNQNTDLTSLSPKNELIIEQSAAVNISSKMITPEEAAQHHESATDDASTAHSTIIENKKYPKSSNWFKYVWGDIYALDDPNEYSDKKKNFIIFLVAMGGLCGPLSSMMYMPGILAVAEDLHTTISAVNGTISAYVVFMGISVKYQMFTKHYLVLY